MERRKIQLIAGTTYSISLPKEWIKKNNLKEHNDILITEKSDRTLILSAQTLDEQKFNEISINADEYGNSIGQIMFVLYYLGIEKIKILSKNPMSQETKKSIRKTLTHMSGTEITYEDEYKITIRVFLDKSKIDALHLIYRLFLIIELSLDNITKDLDVAEIKLNEGEIDRLYHLITKIISLSLVDSNVLYSSNIRNVSLALSYFLISKKLENIGDRLNSLVKYISSNNITIEYKKEVFSFLKSEVNKSGKYIISDSKKIFEKPDEEQLKKVKRDISKIKDIIVRDHMEDIRRCLIDVEEEVTNLSFYNKLISDKTI